MFLSVSLLESFYTTENKIPFDVKVAELTMVKSANNLCCNEAIVFLR